MACKWDGDACGCLCLPVAACGSCDDLASGVVSVLMELFSVGTWMIPYQDLLGSWGGGGAGETGSGSRLHHWGLDERRHHHLQLRRCKEPRELGNAEFRPCSGPVHAWTCIWFVQQILSRVPLESQLTGVHGHIPENHSSNKITFFYYLIDI